MGWNIHLEGRTVSLDEFTFEDHWAAICKVSGLPWLEVYGLPATDHRAAAEVYRQAHRIAGLTAPAEITAPMIVRSFKFEEEDAAPLAPSGDAASASGSDGQP